MNTVPTFSVSTTFAPDADVALAEVEAFIDERGLPVQATGRVRTRSEFAASKGIFDVELRALPGFDGGDAWVVFTSYGFGVKGSRSRWEAAEDRLLGLA